MADTNFESLGTPGSCNFKEAVSINASRIYDCCSDKDCLEDLRVYFYGPSQAIVDMAYSVKVKKVDVLNVFIDVSGRLRLHYFNE